MRIFIIGSGRRLAEMAKAFSPSGQIVLVLTPDEATYRICLERHIPVRSVDITTVRLEQVGIEPQPEDILLASDFDEDRLRATLTNIAAQTPPEQVLILTPDSTRELEKEFPKFVFKSNPSVYRDQLREFFRRHQAVQRVNAIRAIAQEKRRVLTVVWGNPDPDAIACAEALRELLRDDVDTIETVYTGAFTRQENLAMVHLLKIPMSKMEPSCLETAPIIATVDAQPSFFHPPGQIPFDIIIDHHPLSDLGPHRFADVRPAYGATATIFTEYFLHTKRRMSRRLATALLYGLKTDTNNLTRNVADADVDAFRYLRSKADENILQTIELSQVPRSTLDTFSIAISNIKISRDVAFSYIGQIENPDELVYVVDLFVKLADISWAIVAACSPEKIVVLFRADGLRRHAGRLAEEVFSAYGTAGGHRTMARAELVLERVRAEVKGLSDIAIERWLITKLSSRLKTLSRVLK